VSCSRLSTFVGYGTYHLNRKPIKIHCYYGTKITSEAGLSPCNKSPKLPRDDRVKVTLTARPMLMPVAQNLWNCEHGVFTRRMCVRSRTFLASKFSSVFHEEFRNTYTDNRVLNKTAIHLLVTISGRRKYLWSANRRQKSWNYGCADLKQWIKWNNGIRL
jgi:hypothetical protein